MTFEEEFPSLKDTFNIDEITGKCVYPGNLVHVSDVQEHCLDKQKVRGAIEKAMNPDKHPCGQSICDCADMAVEAMAERLIKELGLDKEEGR